MDGHVLGSDSEQPRAAVLYHWPVQQLLAQARSRRERRWPAQMGSEPLTRMLGAIPGRSGFGRSRRRASGKGPGSGPGR